jgi:hypothetical protein
VGHVYLAVAESVDRWTPTAIWHLDSLERYAAFQQATQTVEFAAGEGMIGHGWVPSGSQNGTQMSPLTSPFVASALPWRLDSKLEVHCIHTLLVLAASRHARARGHPEGRSQGDWMPAGAGMTFSWRRIYATDI